MEAVRNINKSELKFEDNKLCSEIGIEFDAYALYSTESRIQSLETLLCYLIKQGKPIDDCLTALNHLKSGSVKKIEKPKQTIPQKIAESIHNGFAILGMFLFLVCVTKTNEIKTHSPMGTPAVEQGEFRRAD